MSEQLGRLRQVAKARVRSKWFLIGAQVGSYIDP